MFEDRLTTSRRWWPLAESAGKYSASLINAARTGDPSIHRGTTRTSQVHATPPMHYNGAAGSRAGNIFLIKISPLPGLNPWHTSCTDPGPANHYLGSRGRKSAVASVSAARNGHPNSSAEPGEAIRRGEVFLAEEAAPAPGSPPLSLATMNNLEER
jgi:hypothetical protein